MRLIEKDGAFLLAIKVVPNSSRTMVAGWLGDALKVKVSQPPEGGKANEAVMALLAETLGVPAAQVTLLSGHTQPRKMVRILAMTRESIMKRLGT